MMIVVYILAVIGVLAVIMLLLPLPKGFTSNMSDNDWTYFRESYILRQEERECKIKREKFDKRWINYQGKYKI